jgi:hypothetical protein
MTTPTQAAEERRAEIVRLADMIARDVAEIDDRTSPEDWPEAMLVTPDELKSIVIYRLQVALTAREEVGWEHWHKLVDAIPDYEWPSPNIYGEWKKSEKVSFVERVVRDHLVALASRPGVEKE